MSIQFSPSGVLVRRVSLMALAVLAFGGVLTHFPSQDDPGPPYYARIEYGFVIQDGNTAAIPFYRDPACIPLDFNLRNLFDAPRAFGCALTVEGFDVWKNGPPPVDMGGPIQSETHGLGAVPVWFLDWLELKAALRGGLTIEELSTLPSLRRGIATFYQETLHPDGAAQVNMKTIVARGALEDGTPFQVRVTTTPGTANIKITF